MRRWLASPKIRYCDNVEHPINDFFTRCHTGAVWTARPQLDKWLWDSQDWSLESWIGIGTDARLKHVFNFPRAMSFNDLSRDYCTHGERLAMWSKILFAHPQGLVLDHGTEIPLSQSKIFRGKSASHCCKKSQMLHTIRIASFSTIWMFFFMK